MFCGFGVGVGGSGRQPGRSDAGRGQGCLVPHFQVIGTAIIGSGGLNRRVMLTVFVQVPSPHTSVFFRKKTPFLGEEPLTPSHLHPAT
jgi:hypothetical protein